MDTVRIGNFPSTTNFRNFEFDMNVALPEVPFELELGAETMIIQAQYFEDNAEKIREFIVDAGGEILVENT
jgi:hypothetical protein